SDDSTIGARERTCPVGERYLIGGDPFPGSVGHRHELDADLSGWIIEPEAADLGQLRLTSAIDVPGLIGQPGSQQVQLAWAHRGCVDDGHASSVSSRRLLMRGYSHAQISQIRVSPPAHNPKCAGAPHSIPTRSRPRPVSGT